MDREQRASKALQLRGLACTLGTNHSEQGVISETRSRCTSFNCGIRGRPQTYGAAWQTSEGVALQLQARHTNRGNKAQLIDSDPNSTLLLWTRPLRTPGPSDEGGFDEFFELSVARS